MGAQAQGVPATRMPVRRPVREAVIRIARAWAQGWVLLVSVESTDNAARRGFW